MTALLDAPLSLFSIPIVWIAQFIPMHMRVRAFKAKIGWNNLEPRRNIERLENDPKVDKALLQRVIRLDGTHQNGLEVFPLWAAAVIVGNIAGMDNRTLNVCSALFVGGRVFFTYLYVKQKTVAQSYVRSIVWTATTLISLYMLTHSAMLRLRSGQENTSDA